jgi:hypothetical protein
MRYLLLLIVLAGFLVPLTGCEKDIHEARSPAHPQPLARAF